MAEKEKRRATTFRTSKGTVVNVAAPTVYVSPAFISSDDVTSPAEMREELRQGLSFLDWTGSCGGLEWIDAFYGLFRVFEGTPVFTWTATGFFLDLVATPNQLYRSKYHALYCTIEIGIHSVPVPAANYVMALGLGMHNQNIRFQVIGNVLSAYVEDQEGSTTQVIPWVAAYGGSGAIWRIEWDKGLAVFSIYPAGGPAYVEVARILTHVPETPLPLAISNRSTVASTLSLRHIVAYPFPYKPLKLDFRAQYFRAPRTAGAPSPNGAEIKAYAMAATTTTDYIEVAGYTNKTVELLSTQNGTINIQFDMIGDGGFQTHISEAFVANTLYRCKPTSDAARMRLNIVPTVAATVTAKLALES